MKACRWCDAGEEHPPDKTIMPPPLWRASGHIDIDLCRIAEEMEHVKNVWGESDSPVVVYYGGQAIHCYPDWTYEDIEEDFLERMPQKA
jgi:hypothetical protein